MVTPGTGDRKRRKKKTLQNETQEVGPFSMRHGGDDKCKDKEGAGVTAGRSRQGCGQGSLKGEHVDMKEFVL